MTLEEEDAVIGRLTRERAELSRRLIALSAELDSIGSHLQAVGKILHEYPQHLLGTAEITDEQKSALDVVKIVTLLSEWKEASNSLKGYDEKLAKLGLG
jgi:hypothetical protein